MGANDKFYVSPEGAVVTLNNPSAEDLQRYDFMGYKPAQVNDIKQDEIRKVYDGWAGAVTAFGQGVISGIPGANAAITTMQQAMSGPDAAKEYAQQQADIQSVHSYMSGTGAIVGTLATAGMLPTGGATTVSQMLAGAAGNMAMGTGYALDQAALAHANTPGGEEKVFAHMGHDLMMDALIGAAVPVGAKAMGKLASKFAGLGEEFANTQLQKQLFDSKTFNTLRMQGKSTQLGQMLDQYGLEGLPGRAAKSAIAPKLAALGDEYNAFKADFKGTMKPDRAGALVDSLGTNLGESHPELAQDLVNKIVADHGGAPNVSQLHDLRQTIDNKIKWTTDLTPELAAEMQPLIASREEVGRAIRTVIKENDPTGAGYERWNTLDKDYSNLSLLNGAIQDTSKSVADYVKSTAKDSLTWQNAMLASVIPGGGTLIAAYKGARAMQAAFEGGAFAGPAKTFAGIFNASAERLTTATHGALLGAAAETSQIMHKDAYKDSDYDLKVAQVKYAQKDPTTALGNLVTAAAKAGLPDDMSRAASIRGQQMQQYLYGLIPQNPTPSLNAGVPSAFRASLDFRQKWIGSYNTLQDPTYGILNPTAQNLDALKRFYPYTLQDTQNAIQTQMRNNVQIPAEAQTWASKIMGYPVGQIANPQFYAVLTQARQFVQQQAQMQAQQGAQSKKTGGGGKSGGSMSNSQDMTAVQKLQNR